MAFPTIIPRTALAQGDRPGANDRIGVAGIGVGRQGSGVTVRLENANRGGGIFLGEKGKMEVFRGRLTSNPEELAKELLETHPRQNESHVGNWLQCAVSGERPIADVEAGHRSAIVRHLLNIARLLGRNLTWDPDAETFVGDAEANAMRTRSVRKGYECPEA